ncbi:MAG: acyl-CoA dehydrogenase family protein [Thermodesulfobacteriota bacterium]|nr:acyl-CoA dehydrogenase family protein [Thermodesulfobacteriota bacterium]
MNQFSLMDDQKAFANRIFRLVRNEMETKADRIDQEAQYPREVLKKFAEFGLYGLVIPKEYGGMGRSVLDACLAVEQIARVDSAAALCVGVNIGGLLPILQGGSEDQKKKYLSKISTGEYIAGVAFSEPEAGSDLGSLRTRAIRKDDEYEVNGRKCFISNAGVSSVYSLLARTSEGKDGISAFILDADAPGFSVGKIEHKMGNRGSPTGDLIFEDCRIAVAKRLSDEGAGFGLAMGMLRISRPIIGAQAVGLATGAFDYTLEFLRDHSGCMIPSVEVAENMLADMAIKIEAARQLAYQTASLSDLNHSESSKFSSMSKCFATDLAMEVTINVMQLFGFRGYTYAYAAGRFMRDAKLLQIYEGTNQIQRLTIARALLQTRVE